MNLVKGSVLAILVVSVLLGCQQYNVYKYNGIIENCESAWFENEQIVSEIKGIASAYVKEAVKFVVIKSCGLYSLQMFGVTDKAGFLLEIEYNSVNLNIYRVEDAEDFFLQVLKLDDSNIENYYAHDIDVDSIREMHISGLPDVVDLLLLESEEKEVTLAVVNSYMWSMGIQGKKKQKKIPKSITLMESVKRLLREGLPKPLYSSGKIYSPDLFGLPDAYANPSKNNRFFELDIIIN